MTTYAQLSQIIPADQALANKALAVSLKQITGICQMSLPAFAAAVSNTETMVGLPTVANQTSPVPPSVAAWYAANLARGSSVNGTFVIMDFLGTVAGVPGTQAMTNVVNQMSQMDLTVLNLIYQQMSQAMAGLFGPLDSGPIVIPSGPAAGAYNGVEVPPTPPVPDPPPPPVYDPTAIDVAMAALIAAANGEIARLTVEYPAQTASMNASWAEIVEAYAYERRNQYVAGLAVSPSGGALQWKNVEPNTQQAIFGLAFGLPNKGLDTVVGGQAELFQRLADQSTIYGQSIVGLLRQGRTTTALNAAGISTANNIPVDPSPPAPRIDLGTTSY